MKLNFFIDVIGQPQIQGCITQLTQENRVLDKNMFSKNEHLVTNTNCSIVGPPNV